MTRNSPGYWTEKTIISELNLVIDELGHFPSHGDLNKMGNGDLAAAITKHGSYNHFREKMGYRLSSRSWSEDRKPGGYWTEENTTSELKKVIKNLDHIPTATELNKMGKSSLIYYINQYGGINHVIEKMGHEPARKSPKYWTEETIISELNSIIDELGYFPTSTKLKELDKGGLVVAIYKYGGSDYFRGILGYKIIHWTEETIIFKLESVIKEIGHFPTNSELRELGIRGLLWGISRHGGFNHFREKMEYKLIRRSWTEESIISELEPIVKELDHFPSRDELNKMGKGDLLGVIATYGGANYFREKMGCELLKKSNGYWTEESIISELEPIVKKLDHFPSHTEFNKMGMGDLQAQISRHGGTLHFMEKCGISPSMQEKYLSKLATYINKRGQKSEQFVKNIITEWTEIHNEPTPNCNVKLSKGNVLEFVCDLDKTIGIDVTNTKASKPATYEQIKRKWKHKDYCLHLDELWIVVFTNVLTSYDYEKLNRKSPDNVKVFSIDGFLKELDYSTENYGKIDRLKDCSFHNKEEIINLNRTFDDDY